MQTKKRTFTPAVLDLQIRRSRSGLGLFANEPILKGTCIIEYTGRELSDREQYTSRSRYLFKLSEKRMIDGAPRSNRARYINHSCKPNCEIEFYRGRIFVMALKHIRAGEELSYDYGKEYFDEFIKPRGCRCPTCAKIMSRRSS